MKIDQIVNQPQHHAYIIFSAGMNVEDFKQYNGYHILHTEKSFGVDDVRQLHDYTSQSITTGSRKILLVIPGITTQAQNALLKMVEEAQSGVYFFIFLPPTTVILPTLLSRCYVVDVTDKGEDTAAFTEFLSASPKERLQQLDALWEQDETGRHARILRLLQNLEQYIHENIHQKNEKIARCRKIVHSFREGIQKGAFHKGTLQLTAFI